MSAVLEFIKKQIALNGPMDTGTYMSHVLGHPKHGYYIRRDPFGTRGDFITAPEISQMFGEMIGAWAADTWMKMGSPKDFILLEGGPGRGTLMADALRATKNVKGFHDALELHFLETSPVLRQMQAGAVKPVKAKWHDTLESVPNDRPIIIIMNELLDALPARQLEKTGRGWMERVVTLGGKTEKRSKAEGFIGALATYLPNLFSPPEEPDSSLVFASVPFANVAIIPESLKNSPVGSVYEFSPASISLVANIVAMLSRQRGAALIIDYGHAKPQVGDSFKAIYQHKFVHPLMYTGDADLSFHVDFAALAKAASEGGARVHGPVGQGAFLKGVGIEQRAQALKAKADGKQKEAIESGLRRLCDSDQMGESFKALGLSHGFSDAPSGF